MWKPLEDVESCIVNGVATLDCIPQLFQNIIYWLLAFAGIVALFLIVFAGIRFTTSGGDPKQLEGAKKTLTYSIAGLMLILFSFLIINLISQVTNVGCIKFFGFTNCTSQQTPSPFDECSGRCVPNVSTCTSSGGDTLLGKCPGTLVCCSK